MSVKSLSEKFIYLLAAFLLFFSKGLFLLDSDFGWHLKMGSLILIQGIPKTDPFSYTMQSYPFVDHEWLTNVFIALLYPKIGMIGLAVVFAVIAVLGVIIAAGFLNTSESRVFFLLAASVIAPFSGVRTQVITWFFFSAVLYVVFHLQVWKRYRFYLPLIFLLWVNMHGGFAVGIVALLVILSVRGFTGKKIDKKDLLVFLLSLLATFCNPYTYRIWWEVWMQISDQSLRWAISEWMPALFSPLSFSFLLFVSLSLSGIIICRKKTAKEELVLYAGLFIASQSSVRHVPLWVIASLPFLAEFSGFVQKKANTFVYGAKRFAVFKQYFGIFILIVICLQTTLFAKDIQENIKLLAYPVNAVEYLNIHKTSGNIFSIYNWGGYLIWKLPEKRVFVDGRMPSWRWRAPSLSESDYAFREYQKFMGGKIPVDSVIKKYHLTAFLLPAEQSKDTGKKSSLLEMFADWDRIIQGNKKQKQFDLAKEIQRLGFEKEYSDSTAVVYIK